MALLALFSLAFAGDGLDARSAVERARAFKAIAGQPKAVVAALDNRHADVRIRAVRALSGTHESTALQALARRALHDKTPVVRRLAVVSMRQSRRGNLARLFTPALTSVRTRARAAEALGALGDQRAVGPLVRVLSAGGTGQRVYVSQTNQVAYIQDFDVEVAWTAFAADPGVGVLQSGVVHSFRDRGHSTGRGRTAIVAALERLTGRKLGDNPAKWRNWYRKNR